jgi:ubiquinone biosynthesis protein
LRPILACRSRPSTTATPTPRLLVMEEIQGIPLRRCPQGTARREAARQLLDSYYRQILTAGFFHADPHPGNLLWWDDKVYFLDFGMVGELGPKVRETLLLLLLVAMWQGDVEFLTDVILLMSPAERRGDVDVAAFRAELATMLARYRHQAVKDLQLGEILQDMSQIAVRQGVPLPAELVLTGKALAQVQLATGELDPDLDPFAMAGEALKGTVLSDLQGRMDLRKLLYEGQKLKVRAARLLEALKRSPAPAPAPSSRWRSVAWNAWSSRSAEPDAGSPLPSPRRGPSSALSSPPVQTSPAGSRPRWVGRRRRWSSAWWWMRSETRRGIGGEPAAGAGA